MALLGVNIDHVATVRQARKESFPDPVAAAHAAVKAGATGITAHLREDRRHIQDSDIRRLKAELSAPLNMEMAVADDIVRIAEDVRPAWACLVPEKREEVTTEGGLDVVRHEKAVGGAIERLRRAGIQVSLFIEPDDRAVRTSGHLNAHAVELHTGTFARLWEKGDRKGVETELARLKGAAGLAVSLGMKANAGHGINYENVPALLKAYRFNELNIGFSIIARSLFVGIERAVAEMKERME